MLIRIRIDLAFKTEHQGVALGLYNHIVNQAQKAVVIHEAEIEEERGFVELEDCYHDEGGPCNATARWEVGKGTVL